MSQSKLVAHTCSGRKARENVREPFTIGVGFTPDMMMTKWREILSQSHDVSIQTRIRNNSLHLAREYAT